MDSAVPFACVLGVGARLMSWRMSGLLVTMPVPRGRLSDSGQTISRDEAQKGHVQVSTNNILQDGALATGLRANDGNLRQIYGVLDLFKCQTRVLVGCQVRWTMDVRQLSKRHPEAC